MKGLIQFINEAVNTTAIVNKIKNAFEKEFGKKVTLASARANYQQLYDVYIYDDNIETLKKVNDILKKMLPIWKGYSEEEMKKKLQEHEDVLKEYGEKYPWKDYPVEFLRFTSRDLRKMLNENINEGLARHEEKHDEQWLERVFKSTKVDRDKDIYVLLRNIKKKQLKVVKYDDDVKDIMLNGNEDGWFFQLMSNDEADMKRWAHLPTFRKDKYKLVTESCDAPEHKIVKDAAGNWRIKGTPGKGTNTDKEGLWAAKYDTEEDAKKALAAFHIRESECELSSEMTYHAHKNESLDEAKKYFVLEDDERRALADCIGFMLGNLGEDEEIAVYKEFKDGLSKEEVEQYDSLYDCLENTEDYKKINRNTIIDDIALIKKLYSWMNEKDMLQEQWDLIDAFEKIDEY